MTDRELDQLIAEGLRGFTWRHVGKDYNGENAGEVLVPSGWNPSGYTYPPKGPIPPTWHVPKYSTEREAGWGLFLWMQQHGSSLTLNWGEDNGLWECSWISSGERHIGFNVDPIKAIALAAGAAAERKYQRQLVAAGISPTRT